MGGEVRRGPIELLSARTENHGMNHTLGNIMVAVLLVLMFLMTGLYLVSSDPAGSPLVSLIINGSTGLIIILTIALLGMVITDEKPKTY
jgi:hypothetical protein